MLSSSLKIKMVLKFKTVKICSYFGFLSVLDLVIISRGALGLWEETVEVYSCF